MWYTIRERARECESYIENSWCQSHNPREPRALWPSSLDVTFPHKGERWGNYPVTDLRCPGQNGISGYRGWDEMKRWNLDAFSIFSIFLSCSCLALGRAIKHVKESIFTAEAGARRAIPRVLVVLTDGRSQDDVNKVSKEMQMDGERLNCWLGMFNLQWLSGTHARVRLQKHSGINSCRVWVGRLATRQVWPFTSHCLRPCANLQVIWEAGQ